MSATPQQDGSAAAAVASLMSMADQEAELEDLLPYLKHGTGGVRRAALSVILEVHPEAAAEAILVGLEDPDPAVREATLAAAEELRQFLRKEAALAKAMMKLAIDDTEPAMRAKAVRVCRLQQWETASWFSQRLQDSAEAVKKEAVAGLVSLDAGEELREAARDSSPRVRRAVAERIARLGAEQVGKLAWKCSTTQIRW